MNPIVLVSAEKLTPEAIVSDVHHLPAAPKVLPRLKRLLQDANASLEEIVKLIRLDPSIALRVLQMGNAAHYSRGQRCWSVEDAVTRVGFDQIYELVALAVSAQVLVRPLDAYGLEAEELWQRSVGTAIAAELVADFLGEDAQIAYTAGLLHAVGMVAIDDWALRHRRDLRLLWQDSVAEFTRSEEEQLGFTQAEVGAQLLHRWEFSPEMTLPLRWQYDAVSVESRPAAVVAVAKWVRALERGGLQTPRHPPAPIFRLLRASPERVTGVLPQLRKRLRAVNQFFEVGADQHVA